nr:hypothetical protein CFP56_32202 [Quercus suber]
MEDTLKSELADALKEASFALETPPDLIVAKMAVDLNIFDILSDSENPVSLESLAKTTGGQDILLREGSNPSWDLHSA